MVQKVNIVLLGTQVILLALTIAHLVSVSNGMNLEALSSFDSPGPNSVFTSEDESKGDRTQPSDDNDDDDTETEVECADENPLPGSHNEPEQSNPSSLQTYPNFIAHGKTKAKAKDVRFSIIAEDKDEQIDVEPSPVAGEESDSSVTGDILDIAGKINATFNKKASLDDSLTADSDGFGSPGLKLDLTIPTADIQDNQNKKDTTSDSKATKVTEQEACKQSDFSGRIYDNIDNPDENASNKLKRKDKKSSLNVSSRRKSRRISLQNVIDLIENENDEEASDKSKSEDAEKTSSFSDKDTSLNEHHEMTDSLKVKRKSNKKEMRTKEPETTANLSDQDTSSSGHHEMTDDIKAKRKSTKKKKNTKEPDKQPDKVDDESLEIAATVDNNKALNKEAPTENAPCSFTAVSNKRGNKDAIHSEINENKTDRKVRKSRNDRRKTQSEIEGRGGRTKTMPKKKLLSLTDLNDQHLVLIEPSKCSEIERPELVGKKEDPKQGRRRKKRDQENDPAQIINSESESSDSSRVYDKENNDSVSKDIDFETGSIKHNNIKSKLKSKQAETNSENTNNIEHNDVVECNSKPINDNAEVKGRKRSKVNHAKHLGDENKPQKYNGCPAEESENKQSSGKEKRSRNRKSKSHQNVNEERNTAVVVGELEREQNRESRGRKRKSKVTKSVDNVVSPKQPKKDMATSEKQLIRVDDTILADKGPDISTNTSQLNDITTQLNLTGNNSVTASLRDGTLSLSMSAVYNNDTMQSILISSQRKSIDEFNLSQRNRKPTKFKSHMPSIKENRKVSYRSSSDSDNSMSGRARKKFRPSIVMTSLHSQ